MVSGPHREFILTKLAEYAKGIPSKDRVSPLPTVTKPKTWEFGLHEHHALKRGLHYDLRLGDPETGHAHSWALPVKWPAPGEQLWAIHQPTHTVSYMDFEGTLPSGYGAGKVLLKDRDKTEVTDAKPGYISFNIYRGTGPEEYSLRHIGGKIWRLSNKTFHRGNQEHLPEAKPDYKEVPISEVPLQDASQIMSAKIDDAHNLFIFPETGKQVRAVSYRRAKRSNSGVIEHTHKVEKLFGKKTPKELAGTIVRGGLFALHPVTKMATEAHILGGMLNADVWKSREKQKLDGALTPVLYDVVRFKGKDLSNAPYKEKLEVLAKIQKAMPGVFQLPQMAFTAEEKKKLLEAIGQERVPETKEGVILWNAEKGGPPTKAKFRSEHDVFVRGFFPGEGRHQGKGVGGFLFSHKENGPLSGRVGTGFTDEQRQDMHKHPEKYLGVVAKVEAQGKFKKTDAFRAPSFLGFHLDKNPQPVLDKLKL